MAPNVVDFEVRDDAGRHAISYFALLSAVVNTVLEVNVKI